MNDDRRVLALWLDGFDLNTAERLGLPTIARLAEQALHVPLDSGSTYLTGLTGEHLANGRHPDDGGRPSAVRFDPASYQVSSRHPALPPAYGGVDTVVFDPCYFDLARTPSTVRGIVDWGAHDPGGPAQARPAELRAEATERFGEYPATPWLYACPWPSIERCVAMGDHLTTAVQRRSEIARWLLTERCPDWRLAFVGVSEGHSVTEGLFHGAPGHPLAHLPSAPAAAAGLTSVYEAIDTLVDDLLTALPDAHVVTFTTHGMGPNGSDIASMVLLAELLARWSGTPAPDVDWRLDDHGVATLEPDEGWSHAVWDALERGRAPGGPIGRRRSLVDRHRARRRRTTAAGVDWMPAVRHQHRWPSMRAFAVPSFYDGRIRVNLQGREARGIVAADQYESVLDELELLLRACVDPRTGEALVASVQRPLDRPLQATPDDVDLVVHWNGMPLGCVHSQLGRIGPFPPRRTGGHTDPHGAMFITGPGVAAGRVPPHSSFDVVPTAFALAGCPSPWSFSGTPVSTSPSR